MESKMTVERDDGPINWTNAIFLSASPIVTLIALPLYLYFSGSHWLLWVGMIGGWYIAGMGITVGYHRLCSHRAYNSSAIWRAFWLICGGTAMQNSALIWSASHRRHHQFTDTERDPYDATRGFWWSHMGWIFHDNEDVYDFSNSQDLLDDRAVMWQHKWYWALNFGAMIAVPLAIGLAIGRPFGMLLFAGLARVVLSHQATFCINSLCHIVGTQPWSAKDSSRDSWIAALVTFGEGYHNYHHSFPADYRNGLKWFHFDPAKWLIWTGSHLGMTRDLKRASKPKRFSRQLEALHTRYQAQIQSMGPNWQKVVDEAKHAVDERLTNWNHRMREYRKAHRSGELTDQLRKALRDAERSWRNAWADFQAIGNALPQAA
jgi:stearoyl-CoA desaturase (Delta-9 desaturase)